MVLSFILVAAVSTKYGYQAVGIVFTFMSAISIIALLITPRMTTSSDYVVPAMNRAIALASPGDVVNCGDWGCYYPYALENRGNIPILFATAPTEQRAVSDQYRDRDGTVIHVCLECDLEEVSTRFPNAAKIVEDSEPLEYWKIFLIQGR